MCTYWTAIDVAGIAAGWTSIHRSMILQPRIATRTPGSSRKLWRRSSMSTVQASTPQMSALITCHDLPHLWMLSSQRYTSLHMFLLAGLLVQRKAEVRLRLPCGALVRG